ncbi:MAG: transglutaminase family protein, partial [Ilumatobacter sp.]
RVAGHFGLPTEHRVAGYEDPVDQAWRESRLPAGTPPELDVDPGEGDDPDARAAVVERLQGDAGAPTGFLLPLHVAPTGDGWRTTEWNLRRGRLYLIPGDSPIGMRLPIDSLTWSTFPPSYERSPFEPRDELPEPGSLPDPTAAVVALHEAPPTSVGFEVRDGHVAVFLPPIDDAEHAVELLAVIELAATELECPIVLQGYSLPRDPRLETLIVTPDPGVIEVNVQPSKTWTEMRELFETLHEEARLARLGTEKFSLDGTHTGTGGGNHVTLGGATPAESPILRRPDLLRSMVTYWQHHPSLSYLFSGQFIGPTSQAPRVDEGRADTLYELEIAFAELDALAGREEDGVPSWLVDRLLRHLLVDLTGNTHRSEFCIDKLFSPDSERGRLGIVELRAFEMPPHPRMALVQALLVRALVARFWTSPYTGRLVRWGTDLYDRFLLPWYVRADIHDVVADLQRHGIDFDAGWLEPFLEFRFPLIGETFVDEVRVELRRAIEPWHVLGEEVSGSGMARYVDSSVERIQVLVDGYTEHRHIVTCNGAPLPLQTTDRPGVAIAGLRFKAWAPWSALHPTIDAQGPLVFDVIDRWSQRSLGGCTYEVSHPGGRSYDTFPVNAAEAEARRAARFSETGHTPGVVDIVRLDVIAATTATEYPRTLDLRRFATTAARD